MKPINEERCEAFKQGGWLLDIAHKVPVYATGDMIPDKLVMDLRGKQVGDKIAASELHLSEGLRLRHTLSDFPIAKFVGGKRNVAATGGKK